MVAVLFRAGALLAATDIWTNPYGGSWNDSGNWLGGIPNATGDVADFSTLVLGSSETVTLDANQVVGALIFGDANLTPAFNWTLATGTGGTLMLSASSGSPVINVVNDIATISAVLDGTSGFSKTGLGNLVLTAANIYSGTTSVSAGTLTLDFSLGGAPLANIINSASSLVLGGGGSPVTLNVIGKSSAINSQTFSGLTINAGASSIVDSANTTANPLLINLGAITRNTGATLNFTQPVGTISATNGFKTSTANNIVGTNGILGGWATIGTTDFATNNGTNIVAAASTNSGTNTAASFYSGINVTFNNNITLAGAITPNSIRFANTANRTETLQGNNIVTSGGILVNSVSTNAAVLTGGTITSGNGQDLIVTHYGSANLTITSQIVDYTDGVNPVVPIGLTKSGTGNLVLNNASGNTYTGATNVNGGTLTLSVVGAIGNSSVININGGTLAIANNVVNAIGSTAVLNINSGAFTLGNNDTDVVAGVSLKSGAINGGNASSTLTSTSTFDLQSGTVSAVLAGSVGLVKSTAGTVTISRAATFTGTIAIKAGILRQGIASALGNTGAVTLGDSVANTGATFDLGGFNANIAGLNSAGTGANVVTNSGAALNTLTISAASTWSGVIQDGTGPLAVSLSGAAARTFSGANTYSGGTTINNGTLVLAGGDNRLSALGGIVLGNANGVNIGVLQLGNAASGPVNQTVSSLVRTATNTGATQRVVGGYYNAASPNLFSTITVNYTNTSTPDIFAGFFGSGTVATNAANNLAFTKTGAGTFVLQGISTHNAGTNVNEGTLAYGVTNALPAAGAVNINGGTLDLAGFSGGAGIVTLLGGSIVDTVGGATLSGSSYAVQSGTISAALGDGTGGPSTLTKTTGSTVTLSGVNTYTGGTFVNAGTLTLGAANTLAATGSVTIAGGSLDLGGHDNNVGVITLIAGSIVNSGGAATLSASSFDVRNGTVGVVLGGAGSTLTKNSDGSPSGGAVTLSAANTYTGLTTVNAGALSVSTIHAGGGGFVVNDGASLTVNLATPSQSLATSGLMLGSTSGGTLTLNLGTFGNPTATVINDSGTLTLVGTNIINISGAGLSAGLFDLITYSGSISGGGSLVLGSLPARIAAVLVNDTADSKIQLNVTGFDAPHWTGTISSGGIGNWDIDDGTGAVGTLNWKLSNNSPTGYYQGSGTGTDSVIFDDSATGTRTVNLTTSLTPNAVTVNNSSGAANTYTFTGSGSLDGSATLTKQGSGTLVIANTGANTFSGGINITAGVVQAGDGVTTGAGNFGAGNISIGSGGTLALDRPAGDNITLANTLSGTGTLSQLGGNVVVVTGNNASFGGTFTVAGGTLQLGSLNGFGTSSGIVQGGAILDITTYNVSNTLAINGGTVKATSGTATALSGAVTLSGGAIADVAVNSILTISGPIGGNGGFTKNNAGTLILSGSNSYAGITSINAGLLKLGSAGALGGSADGVVVASSAVLDLAGWLTADTVTLNAGTLRSSVGSAGAVSSAVTLSGGGTVDVSSGALLTLSNTVGGSGGLTKTSAGTLLLSGVNSYTGGTAVNGGTVEFATAAAIPASGSITPAAGATVAFGYPLDQASLARITSTANAFTVALATDSSNNLDFTNYSNASLGALGAATYSGTLTPAGTTYNLGGGGTLTVASSLTGARGVTVGGGTVVLTGSNTYTGGTTLTGGTLLLGSSSALGSSANTLAITAGTVDLNGFDLTVSALTGAGAIVDNGGDLSELGVISTLTVNKTSGSTTFSGTIVEGTYHSIALVINGGTGTVVWNKSGSYYLGGTTIQSGTLDIRTNQGQVLPFEGDVIFTGTGMLLLNNNGTASATQTLGNLVFNAGLGTLNNDKGGANATGSNIAFLDGLSRQNGAAGNFILTGGTAPSFKFTFTNLPVSNQFLNPGIYYQGSDFIAWDSGTSSIRALNYVSDNNVGNVVLAADSTTLANGFGGNVTDLDLQLSGTGNITAQGGETIHSLKIANNNNLTLADGTTLTVSSGGLLKTGGNAAVISGGLGITTDGGGDLVVRTAAAGDLLTISDSILASTTGGLTKSGAGTLVLSGNNAYTGTTNVLEGTLRLGSATALGNAANGVNIFTGGTLDVAGFSTSQALQVNAGTLTSSTDAGVISGTVALQASSTVSAGTGAVLTLSNVVSGSGGLTKTLTGTVIFSGDNTFTGSTTVSAGIVNYQSAIAFGVNSPITVASGGTAQVQGGISGGAQPLKISGVGATGSNAQGALESVSGNNSYAGLLSLGAAATISSDTGTLNLTNIGTITGATFTLTLAGAGNGSIAGIIGTTTGGITKTGVGTWALSGLNTYTGVTTINTGTLQVGFIAPSGTAQPLGQALTTSAILLGSATGGTLEYTGSVSTTLDRNITVNGAGGGVVRNSGGAVLTLSGTLTKNGRPLTLSGGAFVVSGPITGTAAGSDLIINESANVTLTNSTNNYNGPTYVSGGATLKNGVANALPASTTLTLGEATNNTGGAYDLNGFNSTVAGLASAGSGNNIVTNGGATGSNTLTITGASTFGGVIKDGVSATTSITKSGTGVFTLTAANTYTGLTNVSGGTLDLASSGSLASSVIVNSGGAFVTSGVVNNSITVNSGGKIYTTESSATGQISLNGSLTLNTGADWYFDIGGVTRGTTTNGYDAVNGLTQLILSGVFHLNLINGYTPLAGDSYNLLDWAQLSTPGSVGGSGLSFDFTTAPLGSGLSWDTSNFLSSGSISVIATAPEPGRALLLFAALGGIMWRRRRQPLSPSGKSS